MWNWLGVVVAGLLNGSFAIPIKTTRVWKFEHIWTIHSLLAMGLIPWGVAALRVPGWVRMLGTVPRLGWLGLIGWGVLFGIASLLYGVAVDLLGIALGFAIQLGLSIVLGALLPLAWTGSLHLKTQADVLFLGGLALMVVGVVLCAQAGGAKSASPVAAGPHFRKGLIIALVGGILAPTLNFGITYGSSLLASMSKGAAGGRFPTVTYLVWAVFLSASAIVQAGYCLTRILGRRSAGVFFSPGGLRDAIQVVMMSSVWITSVFLYGRSAFGLGPLGASFGWPIFVALIILASNAWGVALAEWKDAGTAATRRMLVGSVLLVAAAFMIGQGRPSP